MDVHQTRRANLRWLIENECEGVAANLARTLGIQATQLSRIFSENARHRRNIGARLARAIEQATSKRRGWMDEPHVAPEAFGPDASNTDRGNAVVLTPFGDRMVPVLDYVQASEWTASAKPYPITERTEILWTRLPQLSERAFALVVEGESMIDEFYPGDIVIVDPEIAPRPGDYVVAKLATEEPVTFRKYRPRGSDKVRQAGHRARAAKRRLSPDRDGQQEPGSVVGTMVEHRKYRRTARLSVPDHLPAPRGKA